ncbi:MAG: DHH family phosphoesterase [Nanoarchaeota archaeon]|nr:DHH family phosphoesterase [Nanoarchaeota archaeon]
MDFAQHAQEAGKQFLETDKATSIKIISHFDTDGLCACAILERALEKEGYNFTSQQVPHLDNEALVDLDEDIVFFLDLGANKIEEISKAVKGKAIVLDHHEGTASTDNVEHINPHVFDEHTSNIISGAGVTYFFTLGMNSDNRSLAKIALLGAVGDSQERDGFIEYNDMILKHALVQKRVSIGKRLRLYGINSRPLLKVLEYSTDVEIPGVTGSEQGAKQLLRDLNIFYSFKSRNGERPRLKKYYHLRDDEKERLNEHIMELKGNDESILANEYTFPDERRELKDIREYATIINACGRLGEYETALGCLKGDEEAQDKAVMNLRVYKNMLHEAITYVKEQKESFLQGEGYIIIDLEHMVRPSMVGIIASMLARNKEFPEGIIVSTLGRQNDEETKVSLRVSRDVKDKKLQELLGTVVTPFGADAGGHDNAAGAIIKTADKEAFISSLKDALEAK